MKLGIAKKDHVTSFNSEHPALVRLVHIARGDSAAARRMRDFLASLFNLRKQHSPKVDFAGFDQQTTADMKFLACMVVQHAASDSLDQYRAPLRAVLSHHASEISRCYVMHMPISYRQKHEMQWSSPSRMTPCYAAPAHVPGSVRDVFKRWLERK
ncbi:hypothetical protein J8I26_12195 [Herbaspirillum sp. LeCh32-8]|uniref:DUF7673 family protein n=1 Tax=Herbaspirillum sp. LeCh32-8 TaxID=2821356 RepID=UPI001AE342A1|nr:hypothetical protein [Herbaspirillum sp. LeCh32-8]MBP0598872.1 hypothetical protein [Herbaspirillum sp. LeCh32-8]